MTINSTDPFDPPIIDPAVYSSNFDLFTMREAIRAAQRFLAAPAWKDYVIEPLGDLANATTDAQLDVHILANSRVFYHPVSTARMSPKGAKFGVVDPDLRVKGASGLRVADASVLVSLRIFFH